MLLYDVMLLKNIMLLSHNPAAVVEIIDMIKTTIVCMSIQSATSSNDLDL